MVEEATVVVVGVITVAKEEANFSADTVRKWVTRKLIVGPSKKMSKNK